MLWLNLLILLSSVPAGFILAWLARDELVSGRKWFKILAAACLIAALIVAFFNIEAKFTIILTLFYITIVSLISAWKSYDFKNHKIFDSVQKSIKDFRHKKWIKR